MPEEARARAMITQKAPGVIYGLDAAQATFRALDPELALRRLVDEGQWRDGGPVLEIEGSARAILTAERTALNFLQRLSGVATLTARCVRAVQGTGARILDTRKTTPGPAHAREGGGRRRRGHQPPRRAVRRDPDQGEPLGARRRRRPGGPPGDRARSGLPLEVECRTLAEVDEALAAGAKWILLDNMTVEQMREAVAHVAGRATLEASGGLTLETLGEVASTGVDFISVGALTHSAPALDLSLLLEPIS